ncbi:MAG: hypothetical protein D6808_00805 [Candidatus Dadabacteria bacterium]|nr:MAG: hypothetical protein D6808_00805 [Candidatus Dadabacteria bacterium]
MPLEHEPDKNSGSPNLSGEEFSAALRSLPAITEFHSDRDAIDRCLFVALAKQRLFFEGNASHNFYFDPASGTITFSFPGTDIPATTRQTYYLGYEDFEEEVFIWADRQPDFETLNPAIQGFIKEQRGKGADCGLELLTHDFIKIKPLPESEVHAGVLICAILSAVRDDVGLYFVSEARGKSHYFLIVRDRDSVKDGFVRLSDAFENDNKRLVFLAEAFPEMVKETEGIVEDYRKAFLCLASALGLVADEAGNPHNVSRAYATPIERSPYGVSALFQRGRFVSLDAKLPEGAC